MRHTKVKVQWHHTIDSTGPSPPDSGTFSTLPNGDDLEIGSMPCPTRNNAITDYEEIWHSLAPLPGPANLPSVGWILQSEDGKCFVSRIGGGFIGMREAKGEKRGFGVRHEEWSDGEWQVKFVGEEVQVPSMSEVAESELKGEGKWKEGNVVEISGEKFILQTIEKLDT